MIPGFNPMRMKCRNNDGSAPDVCFNILHRPKIEVFADCFPRRINFGDIDGLVELNGCFCMLEWKGEGGEIKIGQRRTYIAFTRIPGNVVFVVNGSAETMEVNGFCVFLRGKQLPFRQASLLDVKKQIRKWVEKIEQRAAA